MLLFGNYFTNVTFFGKTDTNAFLLNGQEKRLQTDTKRLIQAFKRFP